jgi:uncharacterized protein (DUF433 family)
MTDILGNGVYSFSDAARLTGLKPSRVREWFLPRTGKGYAAIFSSDYSEESLQHIISFLDLVEVFVASKLRERGISLQKVRRIHAALATRLGTDHPFGRQEVRTKGTDVFAVGVDPKGEQEIINVLTRQKTFPKIIRPFLNKLDYDAAKLAARWNIAKGVVVDPAICFGQPIVETAGIPTYLIARTYQANRKNTDSVAKWYGLTKEDIQAAVRFERKFAA